MPGGVFDDYIAGVLTREGSRFTNDPTDRGGATKWGITETRARAANYVGRMEDMTQGQATAIYRLFYWQQPMFDQIAPIAPKLAGYMLDIGINQGPGTVSKFTQRSLNVLNNGGTLWPDLEKDGVFGAASRAALQSLIRIRGIDGIAVVLAMVRSMAAMHYLEIAEADQTQEKWEWGWQKRAWGVDP